MSINSIMRGFKATTAYDIEMNALEHNHYILFAIKEFFTSGFKLDGITEADYRREQEIKDQLSNVMLNIVGRFKIDSTIEFEQTTEIYTNKKDKFTINIERNSDNVYYLVLHNNKNGHKEILDKVNEEFMQKCYEFVESPFFYKEKLITEMMQAEKSFNVYNLHMKKQFKEIKNKTPNFTMAGDLDMLLDKNPGFIEYDEEYGYFLRDFIIDLIEKEKNNQQKLERIAMPV